MVRCPYCYGPSEEVESVGDGKCRECLGTGKDQNPIQPGANLEPDSAEKPQECFDKLSMSGIIANDFDGSSVRSFDKLRTGSEALEG